MTTTNWLAVRVCIYYKKFECTLSTLITENTKQSFCLGKSDPSPRFRNNHSEHTVLKETLRPPARRNRDGAVQGLCARRRMVAGGRSCSAHVVIVSAVQSVQDTSWTVGRIRVFAILHVFVEVKSDLVEQGPHVHRDTRWT